jgi:hypothetical protein
MKVFFTCLLLCLISSSIAQRVIRGQVVDEVTQMPIPSFVVKLIEDTTVLKRTVTDLDGYFRFDDLQPNKYTVEAQGGDFYRSQWKVVELTSGKDIILKFELEESVMEEVVISAKKKGEASNEMATVSSREFSVEETNRYAGSRGDPARMASNYAGVNGSDDSRNDIVVRGNSPLGVLWRVEDINIPNPNHFSIAGSQGGPVTILNNKLLANSDFFTGAFPAEFGNSTAGVFDINFRNGNNEEREYSFQFGFLGTELAAEGPFSDSSRASYLVAYRYSTVSLFSLLGINIGTDATPVYQDLNFKLNFPLKNNANLSFFGFGGSSDIDIVISDQTEPSEELYGENDRDQYFGTHTYLLGSKYSKILNEKNYLNISSAVSKENQHTRHNFFERHIDSSLNPPSFVLDTMYRLQDYVFDQWKFSIHPSISRKFNAKFSMKYGLTADYTLFNFIDSGLVADHSKFITRWDAQGGTVLIQPYAQWKYKKSDNLFFTYGFHSQYLSNSNSISWFEPRAGLSYNKGKNSFSLGTGVHSQMQPLYTYYYNLVDSAGNKIYHNANMDFTKSAHFVAGYGRALKGKARLKSEVYYQYLWNVPIEVRPSSFSLINQGSGFARFFPDSLQNTGTGYNYGIELTIEKFFDNNFFFLATGSLYESRYKGSDGVDRNTDYNGNYTLNLLSGFEVKAGEKSKFTISGKMTWAGGKRIGVVNDSASAALNELIWEDENYNETQLRDYFRLDFKVNWLYNAKRVSHEIGLDLVNITGRQNILGVTYFRESPDPNNLTREQYQLGFLPIFYYRIDF